MLKRILTSILVCLLASIFCLPNYISAKEPEYIQFKDKEIENLFDIIRKYPLTISQRETYYQAISQINMPGYARKSGAIVLIKQAVLDKQLNYILYQLPKDFSKETLIHVVRLLRLISTEDMSGVIEYIERETVDMAKQRINDWLNAQEVKMSVGELRYQYSSYTGNAQVANFQYILLYKPTGDKSGGLIIEFYSKSPIQPPQLIAGLLCPESIVDMPGSNCWPWDIWLSQEKAGNNDGKLEPFILRVKGNVKRDEQLMNTFIWDKSQGEPVVEIDFDKPVPQIESSDVILAEYEKEKQKSWVQKNIFDPLGKISQTIQGKGENIFDFLTGDFQALKSAISDLLESLKQQYTKNGGANLTSQLPLIQNLEGLLPQINSNLTDLSRLDLNSLPPMPKDSSTNPINQTTPLNQLIEQYDNITEMADMLFSEAAKLLPATSTNPTESSTTLKILTEESATTSPTSTQNEINELASPSQPSQTKNTSTTWCALNSYQTPLQKQVIFNEVAWMGNRASANDEWIATQSI